MKNSPLLLLIMIFLRFIFIFSLLRKRKSPGKEFFLILPSTNNYLWRKKEKIINNHAIVNQAERKKKFQNVVEMISSDFAE